VPIATECSAAKSVLIRYFVGAREQRRHITAAVFDDAARVRAARRYAAAMAK
jgi:hypothetical protein